MVGVLELGEGQHVNIFEMVEITRQNLLRLLGVGGAAKWLSLFMVDVANRHVGVCFSPVLRTRARATADYGPATLPEAHCWPGHH